MTTALAAYLLQSTLLLGVGLLLPALLRLRSPEILLRYYHWILPASLAIPLVPLGANTPVSVPTTAVRLGSEWVVLLTSSGEAAVPWAEILMGLYCAGVVLRCSWLVLGLARLSRLRRKASPLRPIPSAVSRMQERVGASAEFKITSNMKSPLTFGWRSPAILLPRTFSAIPQAQQEAVATHELIHVRRRDWCCICIEELLRALLWFHPAVWMVLGRIGLVREQMVDRETIRFTGNRGAYLGALWRFACAEGSAMGRPAPALFRRSHLRSRVALLSKEDSMSGFRVFATVILLIAALTLSAAVAARVFPMEEAASMPSMPVIPDGGAAAEMKADGPEKTAEKPAGKPAEKPRIVHKVLANYPDQAKKEGLSGKVVIELTVAPDGSVKHAAVVRSDHEIFEEPSLDAVRQWRFEPAGNGESRPDIVHEVTIQFRLK